MDAWSSPWGDDNGQQDASTPQRSDKDNDVAPISATFASLNSFDASDPWSTGAATPALEAATFPGTDTASSVEQSEHSGAGPSQFRRDSYASASWGDASNSPTVEKRQSPIPTPSLSPQPDQHAEPSTLPNRQQSLSSYDPWAADSSSAGWVAEQRDIASTVSLSDPEPQSTGWAASEPDASLPHNLEQDHSPEQHTLNPYAAHDVTTEADTSQDQNQTGTNLDVWAAEASSRDQKARHLDREEIDKLKLDARQLISSVNTDDQTQSSFAEPTTSSEGWTDLFGSQGTQRDKLHHLQSPPASLVSSSGALRLHAPHSSPATSSRLRSSIASTENRGVRLTSVDNNQSWQRSSRPITKADWLPDQLSVEVDSLSLGSANGAAGAGASSTTSGPGWMQTSSNETRSASGSSFLASFFKGRQPSVTNAASTSTVSQEKEARTSTSSIEVSPATSYNAQFEPYQDTAGSKYTDDPTGPDLMSLDTATASVSAASTMPAPAIAAAQGPGLLSRWRNSGLFKSTAKKQKPSWAASSLRGDDLDWLGEQESSDSRASRYNYDDDTGADDSFDSFQNSARRPPSPPPRTEAAPATRVPDPFDNLFGPAVQTSLNSGASAATTSSARSSLSGGRMSGEGGMMTINTNLARANSLARKSAASPLQPPPQAQNKRMSFAPPPRANAASPMLSSPGSASGQRPAQPIADPFADFLSDVPAQQTSNANAATVPVAATKASAPSSHGKGGGGLTADDLLFFDNL